MHEFRRLVPLIEKSSVDEIRQRFDGDVERFSNLDTGQVATVDAPLAMELITKAAIASTPNMQRVLDVGCGAGNNTLKLQQLLDGHFHADLLDLSQPMLLRAKQRIRDAGITEITPWHGDFRVLALPETAYDVILAAAVLHHLRDDAEWESAFSKCFRCLKPGGSIWITDLVWHETSAIQSLAWQRYGEYLVAHGGEAYRDQVFAYIDQEDSPRPVTYQLELLRRVGFESVELLHKNSCFAAFGAIKATR
ncbi:MAG: class I SAM-dependent methyltransferase [Planctomycetota bacterium]